MALRKNIEISGKSYVKSDFGDIDNDNVTMSFDAYIKISHILSDKTNAVVTVIFSSEKKSFSKTYTVPMSVKTGSDNFIAQAYNQLKRLNEFSDAADC